MSTVSATSNEDKPNEDSRKEVVKREIGESIPLIAFTAAVACGIIVPARGPMVYAMKKNDATAAAKALSTMSSIAAAIELLFNPILGRLSDKYGRKPFMSGATALIAVLHSGVVAIPNSFQFLFINRCITGACIFSFFNPLSAALRDVYADDMQMMGLLGAKLGSMFGLGFAVGPLIGSKLGGAKAFVAGAFAWAAVSFLCATRFPETLALEKRKEFDLFASNPLSFLRLLKNATMAKLVASVGLNSFAEYSNIYDVNFLFLKSVLNYGQEEIGLFATGYGVTQIGGGIVAKQIIASAGVSMYTMIANAAYVVGFGLLGSTKGFKQLVLSLLTLTTGHQRVGESANSLANHAKAAGMGEGEIQGAQANFLAVVKILAPLLFGRVFAWGNARNTPGLPYFLIASFVAMAQLTFLSVDKEKKS